MGFLGFGRKHEEEEPEMGIITDQEDTVKFLTWLSEDRERALAAFTCDEEETSPVEEDKPWWRLW